MEIRHLNMQLEMDFYGNYAVGLTPQPQKQDKLKLERTSKNYETEKRNQKTIIQPLLSFRDMNLFLDINLIEQSLKGAHKLTWRFGLVLHPLHSISKQVAVTHTHMFSMQLPQYFYSRSFWIVIRPFAMFNRTHTHTPVFNEFHVYVWCGSMFFLSANFEFSIFIEMVFRCCCCCCNSQEGYY